MMHGGKVGGSSKMKIEREKNVHANRSMSKLASNLLHNTQTSLEDERKGRVVDLLF
jgi:hypothetical protein